MTVDLDLAGRVAIVTGGSRGIGRAVAQALAAEGCRVVIVARSADALERAAEELSTADRQVVPLAADSRHAADVASATEAVARRFGRIDILGNNAATAGGQAGGTLESVDDEALLSDLDAKYVGYLRWARAVTPHMRARGFGRMIHVGGLSARVPGAYSAGARNIAVSHLSKTISEELGPFGITSNVLHPGWTRTPGADQLQRERAAYGAPRATDGRATNALQRPIEAHEVAGVVAFLASPISALITGESIGVGGGYERHVGV